MEPRIQYAKTDDGVSIAFSALGEGSPLVHMPGGPDAHLQLMWRMPQRRRWFEQLAKNRRLVRYDGRGTGLSEREVADFSLDAFVLDLEAVVARLGLERFDLFGGYLMGPVAIAYASRHREQISHLILWCTWARAAEAYRSPQAQAIAALRDKDWEAYSEATSHILWGWSAGKEAREAAAVLRESITQETLQAFTGAATQFDVANLLPTLTVPTLVLHRRQVAIPEAGIARALASGIPDARFVLLEGTAVAQYVGDSESVLAAIGEFLAEDQEPPAPALAKEAVHTILFTDVEESTALTDRLGDAKAREVLRTHERIVREALRSHGGSEVKTMGDGFMASFSSATKALECAIAMQRAFEEHNETAEEPIRVRVGLNAGEPIAEEEDLFGTAVIVAARIAAKAEGGEIIASDVVRQLVAGKGFLFADRGGTALRGFEDPVKLWEVRWQEDD